MGVKGRRRQRLRRAATGAVVTHHSEPSPFSGSSRSIPFSAWGERPQGEELRLQGPGPGPTNLN